MFVIDGSFFLEKSSFVSAHCKFASNRSLHTEGHFLSTVVLEHRHTCSAELFRLFSLLIFADKVLSLYNVVVASRKIRIGTDFELAMHSVGIDRFAASLSNHLHQVVREIEKIKRKLDFDLELINIKAHQDEVRNAEDFTFEEQ